MIRSTLAAGTGYCPITKIGSMAMTLSVSIPDQIEFRQNLVMEQARLPELMGKALNSLEQRAHPFFGTRSGPKE